MYFVGPGEGHLSTTVVPHELKYPIIGILRFAVEDKTLPAKTHIGSFGAGSYQNFNPKDHGVEYDFPLGDKTLVEHETEDGKFKVVTVYSMLRSIESTGVVSYKVSHVQLDRDTTNPSEDKFKITRSEPFKMFKFAGSLFIVLVTEIAFLLQTLQTQIRFLGKLRP